MKGVDTFSGALARVQSRLFLPPLRVSALHLKRASVRAGIKPEICVVTSNGLYRKTSEQPPRPGIAVMTPSDFLINIEEMT